MTNRKCEVADCAGGVYARGLCGRHYKQQLRHGQVRPDRALSPCAVAGCGRTAVTRGWCHGHYLRWTRTGDLQPEVPLVRAARGTCRVEDCRRPHQSAGLCDAHRQRLLIKGDPQAGVPLRRSPTGEHLSHGYRRVAVAEADRWLVRGASVAAEHRLVLARALGRPLTAQESVHHRNGDRLDNRLENLELWSRYQPSGARVRDLVAWAKAVLKQYGDAELPGYET